RKPASACPMSAVRREVSSSIAVSRRCRAARSLACNSWVSISSRAANSRTVPLRRSSSSRVWAAPSGLLTIGPDFIESLVQLFHHRDCAVHAGEEFLHIFTVEFLAFGVFPGLFGLLPLDGELPGKR